MTIQGTWSSASKTKTTVSWRLDLNKQIADTYRAQIKGTSARGD
jgi:hypothetical protein